jgi:hypothetical protein
MGAASAASGSKKLCFSFILSTSKLWFFIVAALVFQG